MGTNIDANTYTYVAAEDALRDLLEQYELRASSDSVKTDLELIHIPCGERLCDAEAEDTLAVLVSVAVNHQCTGAATGA